MQFMPATAAQFHNDPAHNDAQAIWDAAKLLNQYGFQRDPMRAIGAYNGGPGNPQYGYANQVMGSAHRLASLLAGVSKARSGAPQSPGGGGPGLPQYGVSTKLSGGQVDWKSAGIAALMSEANKPIGSSGSSIHDNTLSKLLSAANSGNYTTPVTANSNLTKLGGSYGFGTTSGQHQPDINLLHHFTQGRTDMGVDASGKPGTPIPAINDSRVVGVMQNWYKGQPYVALQLTAGPNKGKLWYVAEQIDHIPHVGQIFQRGEPVAVYANSGTGIEVGWANPQNWQQTLAQAQGNTGDASHGNAPAGVSFAKTILR
jgi:hypothetical protein